MIERNLKNEKWTQHIDWSLKKLFQVNVEEFFNEMKSSQREKQEGMMDQSMESMRSMRYLSGEELAR